MEKELSEMTLPELWTLFPIRLEKHNPDWVHWFEDELAALPMEDITRISHIGSTAVNGIWAKAIIDILVEVKPGLELAPIARALQGMGYLVMYTGERRISLNKGYTPAGFADRVFHLHLRYAGDHDELYFRDYLNAHPAIAKEYEALKKDLCTQYERDRDGYTQGKTDFVKRYTAEAKRLYGPLPDPDKLHTTELGAQRIRKNLALDEADPVGWCRKKMRDPRARVTRMGKNWYAQIDGCVITVNARSHTIITAHPAP